MFSCRKCRELGRSFRGFLQSMVNVCLASPSSWAFASPVFVQDASAENHEIGKGCWSQNEADHRGCFNGPAGVHLHFACLCWCVLG